MSTILTNGLKLPDKGSVDWYADMQNNYAILDGAVGTIAAHTAALAGKAPAVHTHTKSDVTDLLNSNFIPSANNSYDLGSSSNQWNNVYSKNYFYNGVAWGLDQNNEWSGNNSFTVPQLTLKNSNITRGTIPNANRNYVLSFTDSNNDNVGMIFQQVRAGSGSYKMTFSLNNGTTDHRFNFFGFANGTSFLIPEVSGVTELGSSDNKWKTLNGINPGALSLPDYLRILNIDTTNWSKTVGQNNYTPAFDGWLQITIPNDTDGNGEKSNFITILDSGFDPFTGITASDSKDYRIHITFPVVANHEYYIYIKSYSQTIMAARLIKCLGNVV